jgi:hypothetical protein
LPEQPSESVSVQQLLLVELHLGQPMQQDTLITDIDAQVIDMAVVKHVQEAEELLLVEVDQQREAEG